MLHTDESMRQAQANGDALPFWMEDGERYRLTKGEAQWLDFVRGRYAIADHIDENTEEDEDGNLIYTLDVYGLSKALKDDGTPFKAVCLADDTTLQSIIWTNQANI